MPHEVYVKNQGPLKEKMPAPGCIYLFRRSQIYLLILKSIGPTLAEELHALAE